MQDKTVDELDVLLRAGYPVLYVVSHEEGRVSNALSRLITRRNKVTGHKTSYFTWSCTEGTVRYENGKRKEQFEGHDNPFDVLDYIESFKQTGVFLLKDFGHFLSEGPAYLVQRKLRDLITCMAGGVSIVIVDSELNIPQRLEKLISVVDYDLPARDEIEAVGRFLMTGCSNLPEFSSDELDSAVRSGSNAALGMTLAECENIFAKSLALHNTLDPRTIMEEKKNIIRKSGVLEYYDVQDDMTSVGGLCNLKEWLNRRGDGFSDAAREYGLPNPKGVLIIGIPGTGKSLISKCIGYEWNMPVLKLDVGSLFGSLVGQSEANIRKAIKTAESLAPCVLWIDELEKGFGNATGGGDSGTSARVFGSFLSWMQDKTAPVFVVATANDVSALPPELLRKGRFDELFFVDLPSKEDRSEIFNIHLRRLGKDPIYNLLPSNELPEFINLTEGFSGAEIEQVVIDGMFRAFAEKREPDPDDYRRAVEKTVPLSNTMEGRIEQLRKWATGRAVKANTGDAGRSIAPAKRRRTLR